MPSRDNKRGTWRGQVRYQGRLYRKDFRTKGEAVAWEGEKRRELQTESTSLTTTVMDLGDFFNKHLDYARLRCVPKTYDNKRRVCRRFLEFVGNIPVDEVTTEHVHEYLSLQADIRSVKAFNTDYTHLRAIWAWGQDILDLQSNPVAKIRRLPSERTPQYTPSTADVLQVLVVATREERIFLNAFLHTAGRRSEIFRWTWYEDINFERREVRLGTRKTRDGSMEYTWLPMSEELHNDLWWLWTHRPVKDSPYVFVSTSNRYYGKPFVARQRFMRGLCEKAGVTPFNYHALRRYCASLLADTHKVSAKTIQRVLRHKQVTTTERYIHNLNRDLGQIVNLFSKKSTQEEHPKADEQR